MNVITALGFGLPVAAYFWFVSQYSVNVIYQDQWSDVTVIQRSYVHLFDWGSLWSQHNEDRIFFPNLIVVFLAHTTHFNIQLEEFLSATMLVMATALIIFAHKRRSPTTPWLYYCPVVVLTCSFVQYGATLWGFQMAWYLVLLALATTLVLIDRVTLTWLTFLFAIAAAVIGSFSSIQGLIIWPAGLALLYCRRRHLRYVTAWFGAAAVSVALYMYNFNFSTGPGLPSFLSRHSISPVNFSVFAVGDVVGTPVKLGGHNDAVLLLGLVIVVLAVATVCIYGVRRDDRSGSPVGVFLICFGLLFAVVVAKGRALFGYWAASSSGYTIYDLLILVGIYLTVLGSPPIRSRGGSDGALAWIDRTAPGVARWALVVIIPLQIALGAENGISGAQVVRAAQEKASYTARHIDSASAYAVLGNLNFAEPPVFTRHQVHVAQALHLSLFANTARGSQSIHTSSSVDISLSDRFEFSHGNYGNGLDPVRRTNWLC